MLIDLAITSLEQVAQEFFIPGGGMAVVQAQDPNDDGLQNAISKLAKKIPGLRFTLGPSALYTLDGQGHPIGRTAFSEQTQLSLQKISDFGDIIVTPRFCEFNEAEPKIGIQSHAFYIATPQLAMVCTATPSLSQLVRPVCLLATDKVLNGSLSALHELDFEFNMPKTKSNRLLEVSKQALVFSPESNAALLDLLKAPQLTVSTQDISDPKVVKLLTANAKTLTVIYPKNTLPSSRLKALQEAGATLRTRETNHGGTIIVGGDYSYIGSHRLQTLHLNNSRDVGVMLTTKDHPGLMKMAAGK
jgi:hypothetical protein